MQGGNPGFLSALGLSGLPSCSSGASVNVTGKYLQVTSMYPGEGPCYPVFAETVPYFKRCATGCPASLLRIRLTSSSLLALC